MRSARRAAFAASTAREPGIWPGGQGLVWLGSQVVAWLGSQMSDLRHRRIALPSSRTLRSLSNEIPSS